MQTVYELQKILAHDVNKKQRRYNQPTVTTSTMFVPNDHERDLEKFRCFFKFQKIITRSIFAVDKKVT